MESSPTAWITGLCLTYRGIEPADFMEEIMADPRCDAFGPIHHFIVGAVLLTCYHNAVNGPGRDEDLKADLAELETRSDCVPGGACARWGVCGAAASAGMAYAIISDNAPLQKTGWSDGQLMVSRILKTIAEAGSPRYCKRDSRLAVLEATHSFNESFECGLELPKMLAVCNTMSQNTVCMGTA